MSAGRAAVAPLAIAVVLLILAGGLPSVARSAAATPHPARIDTPAMIAAMRSWRINAVRVPLNEDCWLGLGAARRAGVLALWDAGGGWTCRGGPSLISSYAGAPTAFAIGLRNHLQTLPPPALPALP